MTNISISLVYVKGVGVKRKGAKDSQGTLRIFTGKTLRTLRTPCAFAFSPQTTHMHISTLPLLRNLKLKYIQTLIMSRNIQRHLFLIDF